MRRVDHLAARQLASGNRVIFAYLHHIVDGIGRQIIDGNAGNCVGVFQTEVNVSGRQSFHMKPDIAWPSVLDEMLVLMLVATNVADNVVGRQGDVLGVVEAAAASDLVVEYHYKDSRYSKERRNVAVGAVAIACP